MLRRTKILTTLGPATEQPAMLERLVLAGANVVRLNFSHGQAEDHENRAKLVRQIAAKHNLSVAILGDLQGPKIRIARFKNNAVTLEPGDLFTLDVNLAKDEGDQTRVGVDYTALAKDSRPGDILLLDDGRLELQVKQVKDSRIECQVIIGGVLSNNKGINRKGGGLSASALTDKDKTDIITAAKIGVDYLAISFPRCAEDMLTARQLLHEAGGQAGLVAKIERAEAVADHQVLDAIILASDAVMVARGDLGVEIGDAELISVQKHIISRTRELNRVVITATQMMESMINSPMPTRAEVFDVANAVLDGTDAVMLSAETATGKYPEEVVKAMANACMGAEKLLYARTKHLPFRQAKFERIDQAIAIATMNTANQLQGVKAIICLTESGYTPLCMSRIRSGLPIYAFSRNAATRCKVSLYRGVEAIPFAVTEIPPYQLHQQAIAELAQRNLVSSGDLVLITQGDQMGILGGTNNMKILRVD